MGVLGADLPESRRYRLDPTVADPSGTRLRESGLISYRFCYWPRPFVYFGLANHLTAADSTGLSNVPLTAWVSCQLFPDCRTMQTDDRASDARPVLPKNPGEQA